MPEPPADRRRDRRGSASVFTLIGIVAVALSNLTGLADRAGVLHPDAGTIVAGTVLAGLIVLPILLVAGYYVAVVTSRFGLDPDNHGVPIITSPWTVGVAAVLFAMGVSGVTIHG